MSKRYRKIIKKANGEIRDGQVVLDVADILAGIPETSVAFLL